MRDFQIYLLAVSLLLSSMTGCRRQTAPANDENRTDSGSAPSPPAAAPVENKSPTPEAPPLEKFPTPEERKACLGPPLSPGPEQLPEVEGLRHIVADGEHIFLPAQPGQDRLRADGVDAVLERIKKKLVSKTHYGLGACTSNPAYRAFTCVRLAVPICEPWLDEVRRLAPVVRAEGLGINVEIEGRTGPRCAAGDPDCGPLPYHEPITAAHQETRVWAGDFTLPLRKDAALLTLRDDLSAGRCEGAGDCVRSGCGNHCEAWHEPVHGASCPAYGELYDAHCGCVEGRCAWFTQAETAKLRARVEVEGWQGSIPRQPPPQPQTANALFELRLSDEWMLRQMRRLAPSRSLPQLIEFSFIWHPKTRATALKLQADGKPAPDWLVVLFEHLRMPQPDVQPFRPVHVEGTLRVDQATDR